MLKINRCKPEKKIWFKKGNNVVVKEIPQKRILIKIPNSNSFVFSYDSKRHKKGEIIYSEKGGAFISFNI